MRHTPEQRLKLRDACELVVPGFVELSPAQEFEALADWCALHGIEHDRYGQGKLVEVFEQKIAALLGKPAAVFMPSGVMAQLAAVKVWTETARLPRCGMHPTSHLIHHEEEAWSALLQCHGVPIGDRLRPMLASDLDAGARLWESAAFCGKPHAEIAAGFDSVYVSVCKGIGALSGTVLAGADDFIAQARLWRRHVGGTLCHLCRMVASAAMRFDERLALMRALHARVIPMFERFADALLRPSAQTP